MKLPARLHSILLATLLSVSTVACAQLSPNEVAGGIIGGLAGSQVGGGNGRLAATGLGAVLGASIGRQSQPGYAVPQPVYTVRQPGYAVPQPIYTVPQVSDGTYPIYDRTASCDSAEYIDGNYNPPAARAYCQGRMEREQQLQRRYEAESYERGRRGLR